MNRLAIVMILISGAASLAQEGDMGRRRMLADRLESLLLDKMLESLALTDEAREAIAPILHQIGEARHRYGRERTAKLRELRGLSDDPASSDDEIATKIDAVRKLETDYQEARSDLEGKLLAKFTQRQGAKYLLFRDQFLRKMRRKVGERRRARQRPGADRKESGPRG